MRRAAILSHKGGAPDFPAEDRRALRRLPGLAALGEAQFSRLVAELRIVTLRPHATLFRKGEKAAFLHILLAGRIALCVSDVDHAGAILEILGPEPGLLDPSPLLGENHAIGALALDESRIAAWPIAALEIAAKDALANAMGALAARSWRNFCDRLVDLKMRAAPQRLAAFLCARANRTQGSAAFRLVEDRRAIASYLAMTPETLSRGIAALRDLGVKLEGRAVEIPDLALLRRFSGA